MHLSVHQYVKKDKIPGNEGAKIWVQKVILETRVQELETDEGILEMRVQKVSRENNFVIKLIIVYIDALFELFGNNMLCVHQYFTHCSYMKRHKLSIFLLCGV